MKKAVKITDKVRTVLLYNTSLAPVRMTYYGDRSGIRTSYVGTLPTISTTE